MVNEEAKALLDDVEKNLNVSIKGVDMRSGELKGLRNRIQGRIDRVKDDLVTFDKERGVSKYNWACWWRRKTDKQNNT